MPLTSSPVVSALSLGALIVISVEVVRKWRRKSPYESLPTAKTSAITYLLDLHNPDGLPWHFNMTEEHGHAVRLKGGALMSDALYISDPAALHAILVRDQNVFKESTEFAGLFGIIHHGDGVASVHGNDHKRQRKLIDPAFTNARIAQLTPVFYNVAYQLQAELIAQVADKPPGYETDVLDLLTRTSLEIIAQGGMGHTFNSFNSESASFKKFHWALTSVLPLASSLFLFLPYLDTWRKMRPVWLRKAFSSLLAYNPWPSARKFKLAVDAMWPVYQGLYEEKKRAFREGGLEALDSNGGRDLLTTLFKVNTSASVGDKFPDSVVLANVSSLVHGAQETTSSVLARFIDLLTKDVDLQVRLREEIVSARQQKGTGDDLDFQELMNLPLLDAVVKETFRVYSPVTFVWRETLKDIVIPLQFPLKNAQTGLETHELLVHEGTSVYLGLSPANRSTAIWGPDANEFKPERWMAVGKDRSDVEINSRLPGVYSNMMTFLGGGRSCPGLRFAILEIKLILAVLLQSFTFERASGDVVWRLGITVTPYVEGKESAGAQVPVRVKILD